MTDKFILLVQLSIQRTPFWPFVLMLIVVAVVFYLRALNFNGWKLMVRGAFSNKAVYQLIREENVMENTASGILSLTFFFSLALFFYNLDEIRGMGINTTSLLKYFILLLFIFAIYVIKFLFLYLVRLILDAKWIFEEYVIGLININIMLGIALIPLNLLMIYNTWISPETLVYIGLSLLGLSLVLRFIKGFSMGLNRSVKLEYIILYLCTLEIMPIVILIETLDDFGIKIF